MSAVLGTGPTTPEGHAEQLVKSKAGWLRSIRFHLREQMRREGVPLLRIDNDRRGWPGDPPVGPA